MPCFTDGAPPRLRSLGGAFCLGLLLTGHTLLVAAPTRPAGATPDTPAASAAPFGQAVTPTQPTEELDWAAMARDLGKLETRGATLDELRTVQPFPAAAWVALLEHHDLAVRLGALEMLEDLAGTDMGYDPWETTPEERAEALQRWRTWASTGGNKPAQMTASTRLQPEQLQDYLQDILAGEPARAERAMGKLRPYADQVIGAIQRFLDTQNTLQEGARGRLKEAQYRLLLESAALNDAARLSRHLVFGNRDERVEALESITGAGKRALPIVREMLQDREPLVRERAVDVIFQLGHKPALGIIETHLQNEKDPNIIHAAIRGFGKVESSVSTRLLAGYLTHDNEDLVAAALLSLSLQSGPAKASQAAIVACFKHASWRVRAAALQCATKARFTGLAKEAIPLLSDSDSFVRQAAVLAVAASAKGDRSDSFSGGLMGMMRKAAGTDASQATDALCKAFESDDELKGVVLKAFAAMEQQVPDRLLEQFPKLSPELLSFGLTSLAPNGEKPRQILVRYAKDANPDVACSALRVLAKHYSSGDSTITTLLMEQLMRGSPAHQEAILDNLASSYQGRVGSRSAMDDKLKEITAETTAAIPAPEAPTPVATPQDPVNRLYAAFLGSPDSGPAPAPNTPATAEAPAGKVDALYAAFLSTPAAITTAPAPTTAPVSGAASSNSPPKTLPEALDQLAARAEKITGEHGPLAVRCARYLVQAGYTTGAAHYLRWWPDLNVQHRAELADVLSRNPQPESLVLWQRLLRDPSREIRRKAVESAYYEEKVPAPIRLIFLELMRRDTLLTAADAYHYRLESMISDRDHRAVITEMARLLITDSRGDRQVLAAIMLRERSKASDTELLAKAATSPYFWVRRAAVRSLGSGGLRTLEAQLPVLAKDSSAWVREAIAAASTDGQWPWHHHFNDNDSLEDAGSRYSSGSSSSRQLSEPYLATLRNLSRDREEKVRLAALTALLMNREEVHLPTYLELFDRAPNRKELSQMLGNFVESQYRRLGQGLAPLLERMDWKQVNESHVEAIQKHFGLASTDSRTDFASYAALATDDAPTSPKIGGEQFASDTVAEPTLDLATAPVTAIFFHNPGCHECERVRKDLATLARQFGGLKVQEYNIRDTEAVLLYEALSQRFNVPPVDRLKTPAVFLQSGYLITGEISPAAMADRMREVAEVGETNVWHQIQSQELAEAKEEVEHRVQGLQPAVIFFAGLLDGVNPCAFATIIFLLSYLQVARRTSREILSVGLAFITGVFLTYFVLGLGLVEVVSRLTALQAIGTVVNWVLALGCLVVAIISWRDARLARQGRLQDMTLQLPGFLKDRIRGVIRTGTRMNRFVLAAFGAGVVISVLELACTGQVYLPTIVYAMNTGAANATSYLLLYNVAFIVPLSTVFVLAWGGLRSDALIRFQQRHTATVKYALAILFGILFLVLINSGRL